MCRAGGRTMLDDCLAGVKVVDLSQYLPGPFASKILAELGADVIKVEPPSGDPMRHLTGGSGDMVSPFYKVLNRGKAVCRLDLKAPQGREILTAMVRQADILLESFRPGVLARLGFSEAVLQEINPGLVRCSLSGFGQNGPFRDRAGHDVTYLALSGLLGMTGPADRPVMPFPPVADHVAGLYAVTAMQAALIRRQRTGQGACLDLALADSALALCAYPLMAGMSGPGPGRGASLREGDLLNGAAAYYRIYRCSDGRFLAVGAIEAKFWTAFCQAMGRADWLERQVEPLPQTALQGDVEQWIAACPLSHWTSVLKDVDCCCEAVLTSREVMDHPQVKSRQTVLCENDEKAPLITTAYPCWADGQAPRFLPEATEISAEDARGRWGGKTCL